MIQQDNSLPKFQFIKNRYKVNVIASLYKATDKLIKWDSNKWEFRRQGLFDALFQDFDWCYWHQNRFIIDQQSSREPKNIKPKTALFDTYHGKIYLDLG